MIIEKLNENSKILNLSHHDFDGCVSAIVLSNYFKNITCRSCTFTNIDTRLKNIKYKDYDAVFITDCFPKDPEILKISDNIIVIDHHPSSNRLNDFKKIISYSETCAAMLVKIWIEETFKINLSHLNDLVKFTNDYDLWIHNYKESKMYEQLFWHYSFHDFRDRFITGDLTLKKEEISFLKKKAKEFIDLYENVELFDFQTIKGCFCSVENFINDIADKLLHEDDYEVVIVQNIKNKNLSVRIKDDNVHLGNILETLDLGGGHPKAGGFRAKANIDDFRRDFETFEKYLYDNVKQWRKE